MKCNYYFLWGLIAFFSGISSVIAQNRTVSGTVVDEEGMPLPGVAVIIQGTTIGASTDFDGNFSFEINPEEHKTLQASYIGYTPQTFEIGTQQKFDIQLKPDAEELEEVVVIGYGTAKKEDITGSVASVDASEFNQGANTSPTDLLNGKVAGVQITNTGGAPGSASQIRIRGGASLSASNDPLIIIDGVPVDNNGVSGMRNPLNSINPSDIESFSILKDASATAIYGSRASNGVILITTKRGTSGKITVDYTGSVSVATPTNTVNNLSASEYTHYINTYVPEASHLLGTANTDWQKEIMRNGLGTDHNVSVGGSVGEWLPVRASVGYNNTEGILHGSDMERTTLALNMNPKFFDDHLKVNTNVKGVFVNNRFADDMAMQYATQMDPTQPVYSENGDYFYWADKEGNLINTSPKNPVAMLNDTHNTANVKRLIGNVELDYKLHFLPDVHAKLNLGIDKSSSHGSEYVPMGAVFIQTLGVDNSYHEEKSNELLDFTLDYNKDFGKGRLNVLGGYSWQHFYYYKTMNFSDVPHTDNEAITYKQIRAYENYLVSFFGRAQYTYDDRFAVNATVRADGSSRFAPENRWGIFPSASASWTMSNEEFLKSSETVSNLKLRLSYGITGQQDIGSYYGYMPTYTISNSSVEYGYTDKDGNMISHPTMRPEGYNEDLRWEQTTTYNFGVDYGFLDDRITGTLDVYHKYTKDLLNYIEPPSGTNVSNRVYQNIGSMVNNGVEFGINTRIIQKENIGWDFGFNVTHNRNEVTKLTVSNDPDYIGVPAYSPNDNRVVHAEGQEMFTFYLYEQVYDEHGNPIEGAYVDQNGDGVIDDRDRVYGESMMPKAYIGLNTRFRYKNWDFSASGRVVVGAHLYNGNAALAGNESWLYGGGYLRAANESIVDTKFTVEQQFSDHYVERADFFRLDNIMVGYNIPKKIFNGSTSMRVYGTINNALLLTPYSGLDPEATNAIDYGTYPRPRTFLIGINLNI